MFRSSAHTTIQPPEHPARSLPAAPPARTLEQMIAGRLQQQQSSAHHAPPPAAAVYHHSHMADEMVASCVDHAPTATAAAASASHTPLAREGPHALVELHAHPAADIWRAKWTELATMHIPKHHQYVSLRSTLQQQHRSKLSETVVKELSRLAQRHFRCAKDATVRGRRVVREVAAYWRRSERDAWETRRRADREEAELSRRQLEQKEADRQKKKLEFLLTQTELYSHFIGRKMGIIPESATAKAAPTAAATAATAAAAEGSAEAANGTAPAAAAAAASAAPVDADTQMSDVPVAQSAAALNEVSPAVSDSTMSELLAHASAVKNEQDVSAEEAARNYIRNQQAKMAQFDQLEAKFAAPANANAAAAAAAAPSEPTSPGGTAAAAASASPALPAGADSLDLLNPSTMPEQESFVQAAASFNGTLKSYQLRGLNWLLNLYEQGINGILADEMGLGKTVQSISFLSYLACQKGIWGPFLIVAPNSTLHQWQQEVTRFAPDLKVLPYWGTAKERQILRSFWTSKALYTREAPFHVLITSYNAVVADEKYFHRMRFMYMILDEAQAIKNASSLRWKSLLNLKCRNRVLLTGTPIQNSMDELWALLHFIMGELFDSKAEFSEWFSKDVENSITTTTGGASAAAAATGGSPSLDQRQLQRLHMILKPFMLRREKKDVENEMPAKIEMTVPCALSLTQKRIYKQLQKKIMLANQEAQLPASKRAFLTSLSGPSTSFSAADPSASDNLVTLVMQFRKVCNHSELYEKKRVLSPYYFGHCIHYPLSKQKQNLKQQEAKPSAAKAKSDAKALAAAAAAGGAAASAESGKAAALLPGSSTNPKLKVVPLLVVVCPASTLNANPLAPRLPSILHRAIRVPARDKLLQHSSNIFSAAHVHSARASGGAQNTFSFLSLLDMSLQELEFCCGAEPLHLWFFTLVMMHRAQRAALAPQARRHRFHIAAGVAPVFNTAGTLHLEGWTNEAPMVQSGRGSGVAAFGNRFCLAGDGWVWRDPASFSSCTGLLRRLRSVSRPAVIAAPAYPLWSRTLSSPSTGVDSFSADYVGWEKSVLLGSDSWKWTVFQGTRNKLGCAYPASLNQSLDLLPVGLAALHKRTFTASPFTERQGMARWVAARNIAAADGSLDAMSDTDDLMHPPSLLHDPHTPAHLLSRTLHASSVSSSVALPGLLSPLSSLGVPASRMVVPTVEDLIADSGKLQVLDKLLVQLKAEGHRVLIFSQMTKLIDLLESFLRYRHYKFARLDGQTALAARRDIVRNFQQDTSVFAFLLSTRAGGLGINLTSADTVIFYDSDWNPSCDEQAMDRVHRIGQTRQVTVYRLVCSNTVEERILIRAQQKHVLQHTVYSGGFKMASNDASSSDKGLSIDELFTATEIQSMLAEGQGGAAVMAAAGAGAGAGAGKSAATSSSPASFVSAGAGAAAAAAAAVRHGKRELPGTIKEESGNKRQRGDL